MRSNIAVLGTILGASLFLGACASQPIIDTAGKSMARYDEDLAECQAFARQVNTAGKVAGSAATGAAVGAAVGAIVGDSDTAARGAGVGATTGVVKGAARSQQERQRVVHNCLRNRGYAVLN